MKNLTTDELINRSTEIILQEYHTDADKKELSKILYLLSLRYRDTNMSGSAKEWLYNWARSSKTVELQETMAVWKAENIAKSESEVAYGSYREVNADAQWLAKVLSSIDWFIIGLQSQFKAEGKIPFNS